VIKGSITAKPQVFAAAVKWAAKFVADKPSVPVHGGLTLDAEAGQLTVTAFGENVTARATLPIEGDGAGRAIVSGRLLDQLAATFPAKPVTITGDADGQPLVTITAGRWRGTLPAIDEKDLPDLPVAPEPIGTVHGDSFASMIALTAVAASTDLSKQIALACIHLTFDDDEVRAIATDAYRAASSSAPFFVGADLDGAAKRTALVLAPTMTDVAGAFAGPDDIEVGLGQNLLSLTSPTRSVVMRQMGEEFNAAAIGRFFEQAAALPEHAQVKAADLLQPLKRAALVRAKDGPIKVKFSEGLISLAAAAEDIHQDSDEEVEATYAGPEHTLAFNPEYFAQALASAPAAEVDITMTTERVTGVLLTCPGNPTWQHVLMPLKLR
jgi:DNA polymerase III subunit beta